MSGRGPAERSVTPAPSRPGRARGAALALALAGLAACGPVEPHGPAADAPPVRSAGLGDEARPGGPPVPGAGADAGEGATAAAAPPPAPLAAWHYAAYVAETLRGDRAAARRGYEAVLEAAGEADRALKARAALRLADLVALEGHRREALDLVTRAAILGSEVPDLVDQAERLRVRLAAVQGDDAPVSGPAAGTALDGVSSEAADRFHRAEELLVAYHAIPLRPRLEELGTMRRRKEVALDAAVRAYRKVGALGEPVATSAAEFRVGSLYHDFALALAFDFPPELLPELAEDLRRSLRRTAFGHLRRARAAYGASFEAARGDGRAAPWQVAARAGARAVDDILRAAR